MKVLKIFLAILISVIVLFGLMFAFKKYLIQKSPLDAGNNSHAEESKSPIIQSISPASGSIGTIIELSGINLAGFEGDLDAIIENSKGETAYLNGIGTVSRDDKKIRVKIDSKICKKNNSYTGDICTSYLTITPGVYYIYTSPWGNISNKVEFKVTP